MWIDLFKRAYSFSTFEYKLKDPTAGHFWLYSRLNFFQLYTSFYILGFMFFFSKYMYTIIGNFTKNTKTEKSYIASIV